MMSMRSEIGHEGVQRDLAGRELDVGALGRSLKRHRRWIIGPAVACCVLATAFVSFVQPRYTANSKVIIENGESYFTRPDKTDVQQAVLPDDEAIQSQVQLISSRDIAREAIRRLDLKGNPEFDPAAKAPNLVTRLLIITGLEQDPTTIAPEDRILQSYYDRLMVFPVAKSRVISIEFTATDADLAARAANTIVDLYLEAQSATKRASAKAAADSLASLIADLRTRAADAESKADAYRSRSGLLLGTNNTTISAQQLADVNTQLAQARTAEADAQAKAKLLREMIRQGRISEVPDVANNELIRRISEQRVSLRAEVALQSRTLLPGHPRMQELNAQLQDIDSQLRIAAEKAVRTLENDAHIAAGRVENLTAALEVQKTTASLAGADQVHLTTLDMQARLLKDQLEFNTSKYQEALARQSAASTPADARVISRADAPQLPSFPKKLPIILIATLAGLLLSIGIVIGRELLSGKAFAEGEAFDLLPHHIGLRASLLEQATPMAVADTPATGAEAPSRSGPLSLADTLRDIRLRRSSPVATRIFVSGTSPNAETARGALDLGRQLAIGARTILVDIDRAAPAVDPAGTESVTGSEPAVPDAGLTELLAGTATFAEIIHRDTLSRLHIVPVGRTELPESASPDYGMVVEALAETYDFVLLHSAQPHHELARQLAAACNAAVLILAEGQTDADAQGIWQHFEAITAVPLFRVAAASLAPAGMLRQAA